MSALRALLSSVVDYAGLFPPASLDMAAALRNYVSYESDRDAWMLGRFIAPISRIDELRATYRSLGDAPPIRLSVVIGSDIRRDVAAARSFKSARGDRLSIVALEARLTTISEIEEAAALIGTEFDLFAELPLQPDPAPLVDAVGRAGASAKMRTGGVTAEAFPPARGIVRFMRRCLEAGVRFKATAGLHHPVRAEFPLTYDAASPRGMMFGYLNVFLAAAFLAEGLGDADAARLLDERDATSFSVSENHIAWRGHSLEVERLVRVRERVAVSFGSCSFREPVDELHALSLLE